MGNKKMTSKERLLAAMKQEELDIIPLAPRMQHVVSRKFKSTDLWAYKKFKHNFFDCDLIYLSDFPVGNPFKDCEIKKSYLNDVSAEVKYECKGDLINITRIFHTPAGQLKEKVILPKPGATQYGIDPDPCRVEYLIKDSDDLEKIRYLFPKLEQCNFSKYHHECELMGNDGIVQMYSAGPMDFHGGEAYPVEQMMIDYYLNPNMFDALLNMFADYSTKKVKIALENGVRHFFLVNFYASISSGWSPEIIEEKFIPIQKHQIDLIHSYDGLAEYYDSGKIMQTLQLFINAGADVISTCAPPPLGDFDLIEARLRWGISVTFKGHSDMINIIARGTPEKIDEHVKNIIISNNGKRAIILGTMDNIRPETSDENIAAYFNAANKYR
jgi:hypothetical protein